MGHVFREHNKEADHWASVRAGGKKEIVVDNGSHEEVENCLRLLGRQL